jgi:2-polyprenyl-3-methyl-5-hydroxy-6-metoxy-1,4-benzoquinol methylase
MKKTNNQILEAHLQKQLKSSKIFFWHRLRWEAVKQFLPKHNHSKLLDIGAGAGILGMYLKNEFPEIQYKFIEPIKSLSSILESKFGTDQNYGNKTSFHEIQLITLLDVLEHQQDDRAFLIETLNKLDNQSTIIITVPAHMYFWSHWDSLLGHYRRYTKHSLQKTMRDLPIEIMEISYLFPEMVPFALVRKFFGRKKNILNNANDAEFIDIPESLNKLLYYIGKFTLNFRKLSPFGTSILLVARKL